MASPPGDVDPRVRVSTAVLRTALIAVPLILVVDVIAAAAAGVSPFTAARLSYVVTLILAVWQLRRPEPNALWLMYPVAYGLILLSVIQESTDLNVGSLSPPTTMAVLVAISMVMAVLGGERWFWHPATLMFAALLWTGWITTRMGLPAGYAALQGLVAGVTLIIGAWLVRWTASGLEERAREARRLALFHEAIATCSEYLHRAGGDAPEAALRALLPATNASSVFVSRNVDDPVLGPCTALIREVYAPEVKAIGDELWALVPWSKVSFAYDALSRGQSVYFEIADTSPEEQAMYAGMAVTAEANIPIVVDGTWQGILGCSYDKDHQHDPADLELLETAARIFGAYWKANEQRAELEHLVRSKDELIAAVSHELRTPLTGILGFAEAILETDLHDQRDLIELIARSSRDMADIIDDLLVSARLEAGTLTIRTRPVDLAELAQDVSKTFQEGTDGPLLPVAGGGVVAAGDPVRVRQIVRNLVSNAITHGGDRMQISIGTENGHALLSVRDNGHLTADQSERVFERFYSGEVTGSQPGSVGIGLFVSRQLARLMDGDLIFESSAAGTEFTLMLPVAVDAVAAASHT